MAAHTVGAAGTAGGARGAVFTGQLRELLREVRLLMDMPRAAST